MLIVGLGNPGPKHVGDRHNVGFWLADLLAAHIGTTFSTAQKLQGEECRGVLAGKPVRIVKPATYMNRSGQCVRRVLAYYNIPMEQLLVLHDELDLPAGSARLKRGGGHGGHNGLRDILASCGPDFMRLRIGIGHPGHKDLVTDYVLHAPGRAERCEIVEALGECLKAIELLTASGPEAAMQQLHSALPRKNGGAGFGPAG
ncbi:MAG: aminoacyl-tRNA hydrolase [Gammaproteobacteria bacterium]|nr:aminoacyl-tRNA hydrolase [Gammaproteobacteria bacterium]MCP5139278.1 aminoacyl-tRNA hydrolase [Chromatiales bacterium]